MNLSDFFFKSQINLLAIVGNRFLFKINTMRGVRLATPQKTPDLHIQSFCTYSIGKICLDKQSNKFKLLPIWMKQWDCNWTIMTKIHNDFSPFWGKMGVKINEQGILHDIFIIRDSIWQSITLANVYLSLFELAIYLNVKLGT